MKEITLTINGKQVKGREGDTVLDICEANDIYVPTLCHLKGLTDVGACRMCVVEIERERRPVPACTYPARDGIVVQTHNEKLEKYRRLILELMFTERNHLCAQCVASGDCELQSRAYEYQMENARYPYAWPALPVDSVNKYLVIDHNRCILCGRCIRICDEMVGVHTLDFGYRGWKDTVVADLNQPLGQSTCISCGACFQACPTGTIYSKDSAYKGRPDECQKISSVCPICGIGCKIEALVKDNRLVRIDSPDMADKRGILCHKGRFVPLEAHGERVGTALVRNGRGRLEPRPLAEAIATVAGRLAAIKQQHGGKSIAGIASSQASNEALAAFRDLMTESIGSELIDTLDGDVYRTIARGIKDHGGQQGLDIEAPLEAILKADCIVVIGADPVESHPVAGSYVARAARQNQATLIVVDPVRNAFPYHASLWLKPKENKSPLALDVLAKAVLEKSKKADSAEATKAAASLQKIDAREGSKQLGMASDDLLAAAELLGKAKRGVVVYGDGILQHNDPQLIASILRLASVTGTRNQGRPQVISLKPGGNSRGAWDMGIAGPSRSVTEHLQNGSVKALYVLISDDAVDGKHLAGLRKGLDFLVIQSSYLPPGNTKADVILPSPTWTEVRGKYTTLDGATRSTSRLVKPPRGIKADPDILNEISRQVKR